MHLAAEKVALVDALACVSDLDRRGTARLFLEGLSIDELQYIAAYLGTRLLAPELELSETTRAQLARQIGLYEWNRKRSAVQLASEGSQLSATSRVHADLAHKMILLLEYLSIHSLDAQPTVWVVQAGSA